MRSPVRRWSSFAGCLGLLLPTGMAQAKPVGIGDGQFCGNCHEKGQTPVVKLTPSTMTPALGQTVQFTVSVTTPNGNIAGFMLDSKEKGAFTLVAGEGTKLWMPTRVTHAMPKMTAVEEVTFRVDWKAPNEMTGVKFSAFGMSGNGDNTFEGDGASSASLAMAVGCNGGRAYFQDFDKDGFGNPDSVQQECAAPDGFIEKSGDCNDFDDKQKPGGVEICNSLDDDCDGMTDEGLPEVDLYEDMDSDGYGAGNGPSKKGCGAIAGFGVGNRDCNDNDARLNPGAKETCNDIDDNCDGRVDEGVRPQCGVGFCARVSPTCSASACTPGRPKTETCNLLDDDCDGQVDEDAGMCSNGGSCVDGACQAMSGGSGGSSGGRGGSTSSGGSGGDTGGNEPNGTRGGVGCGVAGAGADGVSALWLAALVFGLFRRRRPIAATRTRP